MPNRFSIAAVVLGLMALLPAAAASSPWRYQIKVDPIATQKTVIVNDLGYPVRVHVFQRGDLVRGVPMSTGNRIIGAGRSWLVDSSGSSYRINVFKSQLIDQRVATDLWLVGRTTLSQRGGKVIATTTAHTKIRNRTNEEIKVCIYNERDLLEAVPKAVYTIKPGKTITYPKPDTVRFRVSVFRPALFDQALATKIAHDRSVISVDPWPALPKGSVIWAFGDSLTAGVEAGGGAEDSYPAQLQELLGEKYTVVNQGVVGEVVSAAAAAYFEHEQYGMRRLKAKLDALPADSPEMPDLILLCQGANDRVTFLDPAVKRTKIEEAIKSSLKAMIQDAEARGIRVVLIAQAQEEIIAVDGEAPIISLVGSAVPYYRLIAREAGIPVDSATLPAIFTDLVHRGTYLTPASDRHRHLTREGNQQFAERILAFLHRNGIVTKE